MGILSNLLKRKSVSAVMCEIQGFQIVYNATTLAECDPDFEPLDNSNSDKPDWFEYWPIRNFLLENSLNESTLYGFLSPRFKQKTGLSGVDVYRFIESSSDADVFTFSPAPCHGAFFLNAFEHGDFFDPGSLELAAAFFERIDAGVDLRNLVNHSGNLVFSNYFFAKPRFWREWMNICNQLFEAAEGGGIGEELREQLTYKTEGGATSIVQRKVFLMERIAPYLLANSKNYVTVNFPIRRMPISDAGRNFHDNIYAMDDLKKRYAGTGEKALLEKYRSEQKRIVSEAWPGIKTASFIK
jgi:hypothetical protein